MSRGEALEASSGSCTDQPGIARSGCGGGPCGEKLCPGSFPPSQGWRGSLRGETYRAGRAQCRGDSGTSGSCLNLGGKEANLMKGHLYVTRPLATLIFCLQAKILLILYVFFQ